MSEKREFIKNDDGTITVEITSDNIDVYIPVGAEQISIGKQETRATQKIDNVDDFLKFMREQLKEIETRLTDTYRKLDELEHINVDIIPESIMRDITDVLKQKKSKTMSKNLLPLAKYIDAIHKKREMQRMIEFYEKSREELIDQNSKLEKIGY